MNAQTHQHVMAFQKRLHGELVAAMQRRSELTYFESTPYGSELMWVIHERNVMHEVANARRRLLGLDELTLDQVHAVEQQSAGHSDYASKFTLRLATLTYGEDGR